MKILLINYEYPPLGGGGGIFARDLAEELAKEHEVDVLTSHFKGLKKNETVNGVNIFRVPIIARRSLHAASMLSLLSFPVSCVFKGISLLRKKKYDIINTHFAVPSGPAGTFLSRSSRIPNVLNIIGGDIYDPSKKTSPHRYAILRWAVRSVMNASDRVLTESADIAGYAKKIYKSGKEITVIPMGIPLPHFTSVGREALSLNDDRMYLISVGRLVKRKGFEFLLKALALLRDKYPALDLILVGDGPERESLEKLSVELGISHRVVFAGSVSNEKKYRLLFASDIYVLPSLHEGFGIVLLEAMFCGLPVVATDNGGQTEIVTNNRNGLLVKPADAEALAEAIHALAKDPPLRRSFAETNKKDIMRYDISAVARSYVDIFREILSAKRGKRP